MAANPSIDPERPSPSRYEPDESETDRHAERLCRYQPTIGAFAVTTDPRERQFKENWQKVLAILEQHTAALTSKEIAEYWQDDESKPRMSTLYNWFNLAAARKLVRKEGQGTKSDPWRYRLANEDDEYRDRGELPPLRPLEW